MFIKERLEKILPPSIFNWLKEIYLILAQRTCVQSLRRSLVSQKLKNIYEYLSELVPDISQQYSSFKLEGEYMLLKVRALHAFQISLVKDLFEFGKFFEMSNKTLTFVDIGDSAGTHIQYIKKFFPQYSLRCLSVNIDEQAVERIKAKGLEAICSPAENLTDLSIDADVFLSFEMIEHLMNPCEFLHRLSEKTNCKAFIVTVPFMRKSRVGLRHIRRNKKEQVFPENTHIFELSPSDWQLIFKHSGWKLIKDKTFYQYSPKSILGPLLRKYWQFWDYEGFYGAILVRDSSWSTFYKGWDNHKETKDAASCIKEINEDSFNIPS